MSKEVAKYGLDKQLAVSEEQLALVKRTIFPGATDDELKLFVYECQRRGVHPMDRKVFPVRRKDNKTGEVKVSFQTSIDLFRSEAAETGEYAGQDDIEYGPEKDGFPEWAKCTVKKLVKAPDNSYTIMPISATARWKEFYPGEQLGFMWRKMPALMLGKCAEAQAIRKAFPQKLGGLYVEEEMQKPENGQATTSFTDSVQEKKQAPPPPKAAPSKMQQQKQTPKQTGLGLGKKQPEDFRPKDCTQNANDCNYSSFVAEGEGKLTAICSADGQKCGYPQEG